MKFNWGTGVVLAFIGFISFIMYFVISMNFNEKYNHDLVTEDYYKVELAFQNEINKLNNTKSLEENISWTKTSEGLFIKFPKNFDSKNITGKVFLYRPSNKHLDFETPISLSESYLLVPDKRLLGGRWNITIDWKYDGKAYLYKASIIY